MIPVAYYLGPTANAIKAAAKAKGLSKFTLLPPRFFAEKLSYPLAATTSSGVPIARVETPAPAVRLIIPDKALPAPISQNSVTPAPCIQSTDSLQRTDPV